VVKASVRECDDGEAWDGFVQASPQGSVFSTIAFLDGIGVGYDLWWAGGQPEEVSLAVAVLLDAEGRPLSAPYSYSMYHGPMFSSAHSALPVHTRTAHGLQLLDMLLGSLEQRYDRISFCTHPLLGDLRAFSWFHYHEPHLGCFGLTLSYSGWIDLAGWDDVDEYLSGVRTVRRQEYRRALKSGMVVGTSDDVELLVHLHRLTFERQGLKVTVEQEARLRAVAAAALAGDFGEILLCTDRCGTPASAALFLFDSGSGYYLVGANDPDFRKSGAGTFTLVEAIRRCKARGLDRVDVCGINSPSRGDFKTSLSARPVPYFVAQWERP
jgi:hypothetical protein